MSSCCCSLAGTAACKNCANNPYATGADGVMAVVSHLGTYVEPQTNYDRIVSKTPEELARFITDVDLCELLCGSPPVCDGCWCCEPKMLLWLKAPVEVDE